jgi:DNA-binding transcriptional LysR family regulator
VNLDLFRSFTAMVDQGSLNQAAARLHVSQSTLTRQLRALEHIVGGLLFERSPGGLALTATGHVLADGIKPALGAIDAAIEATRKAARGQSSRLRIGYLMSVAAEYLHPALGKLRQQHPEVKVQLLDLSPGEQIAALRKGEIDLALIGSAGAYLGHEFYLRKLATFPAHVALAENHPLAGRAGLRLAELRGEKFIGANDLDLPGYNAWLVQLCRRAGFRPRLVLEADSLTHSLATIVTEGAVALLPAYTQRTLVPGVMFVPLQAPVAKWDLWVAWQRGKVSAPVRAILAALPTPAVAGAKN